MKLSIEFAGSGTTERTAILDIAADELECVHLHLAFPDLRNRTESYLRRHRNESEKSAIAQRILDPNKPFRLPDEAPKLSIPSHTTPTPII